MTGPQNLKPRFFRSLETTSASGVLAGMGPVWSHSWQRQLDLTNASSGSTSKILAYGPTGEPTTFNWSAGFWRTTPYSGLTLTQSGTHWNLSDPATGVVETYSPQGVLLSERSRTGFTRTLTYDSTGQVQTVVP